MCLCLCIQYVQRFTLTMIYIASISTDYRIESHDLFEGIVVVKRKKSHVNIVLYQTYKRYKIKY